MVIMAVAAILVGASAVQTLSDLLNRFETCCCCANVSDSSANGIGVWVGVQACPTASADYASVTTIVPRCHKQT